MLKSMGAMSGAEIGVWMGEFSEMLCRAMPGLRLTCVDPWLQYKHYNEAKNNQDRLDRACDIARERLAPFGCQILRMTSAQAAKQIPERSLDFVYIDGNHMRPFVDEDLALWSQKVRIGGIVAGHDYEFKTGRKWNQVREAVDAFVSEHHIQTMHVLTKHKAPSFYWVQR